MSKITFDIPGEPTAQGRPRFSARGGFVKAYDPAKSRDYKSFIKVRAADAMKNKKIDKPLDGAIFVKIWAFVSIPSSKSKKFKEAALSGNVRPTKKPDVDNLAKIILDALSGILYEDDKQIVCLTVEKWYSACPRAEVVVEYE